MPTKKQFSNENSKTNEIARIKSLYKKKGKGKETQKNVSKKTFPYKCNNAPVLVKRSISLWN